VHGDGARGAVVVTGSSTGIGRACALHLDRLGFKVFAGVRKEEDGEQLRAEASERFEPLLLDVTDPEHISRAAEHVSEATGARLAGLVNNAGIGVGGPLELLSVSDFRHQIEVNLIGQVAVTQAFIPALRRARGRLVFISSIGGLLATPYMSPYHASKFGIEAVGDVLRQELRQFGVQVSIVQPGSIATPIWEKGRATARAVLGNLSAEGQELYGESLARTEKTLEQTAGRGAPPEKVAKVVAHALTARRPRTRYLVGADARAMATLKKLLPDRLRDRLVARAAGLTATASGRGGRRRATG
jgi:NAD(P)-dependent dehydrogenase (short-subunit alcohol dehydrogenase family)